MSGGIPQTPFDVRRQVALEGLGYRAFPVWCFIQSYHAEHGFAPTYSEIKRECGIATNGEVSRIIASLERWGFLARGNGGTIQTGYGVKNRRIAFLCVGQ